MNDIDFLIGYAIASGIIIILLLLWIGILHYVFRRKEIDMLKIIEDGKNG